MVEDLTILDVGRYWWLMRDVVGKCALVTRYNFCDTMGLVVQDSYNEEDVCHQLLLNLQEEYFRLIFYFSCLQICIETYSSKSSSFCVWKVTCTTWFPWLSRFSCCGSFGKTTSLFLLFLHTGTCEFGTIPKFMLCHFFSSLYTVKIMCDCLISFYVGWSISRDHQKSTAGTS